MTNRTTWMIRPHNLWRWPLALLLRAPLILLGVGFRTLGNGLIRLGELVPGITEFP